MGRNLSIIFITVFIDLVGFGMIIPMIPYLATDYGASALYVGLLMTSYSLMQFFFAPLWGTLSDSIGRRPVLLISLVGAGLAHLFFAFSESFWMLLIARLFAGLFSGNISVAMASIADVSTTENRSKSMGLIGAAFGLGFIFGPALGGLFSEVGLRLGSAPPLGASFPAVLASLICLANAAWAYLRFPETLKAKTLRGDWGERFRLNSYLEVFSRPTVRVLLVLFFFSSLAMAHMEATLFLFVRDLLGWNMSTASYGFAYVGIVMVLTQGILVRRWLPHFGERRLLIAGSTAAGFGLIGVALFPALMPLAIFVTFLGLGIGVFNPSLSGSLSLLTKESDQGRVLGFSQSMSAMGRILGPVLGGFYYDHLGKPAPFIVGGLLFAVIATISLIMFSRLPDTSKLNSKNQS